jgi:hypothetical protein
MTPSDMHTIELLLDPVLEAGVRELWDLLRDAGLSSLAAHPHPTNRPHLTVLTAASLAGFPPPALPIPAELGPVRFLGRALVREVTPTAGLRGLHARTWTALAGASSPTFHRNRPQRPILAGRTGVRPGHRLGNLLVAVRLTTGVRKWSGKGPPEPKEMRLVATTGFWQRDPLRTLGGQAATVELKVVLHQQGGRSLGIDPEKGPVGRIYFLDTPDLALYRHGVVIRFRDRPQRRDDAVVKLRPVVPGRVPGWLRDTGRFHMEIDALPGHAVCSGALKQPLGRNDVSRAVAAGRPLTRLLSPRQHKLLARYSPSGVRLGDLTVFGPILVRRHNVKLRGLDRGLTAERWRYPDGSDLLELSTRCSTGKASAVAARVSTALRSYGVEPADRQRTKTELALRAA